MTGATLRDMLIGHALTMLDAGEADLSLRAVARAAGVSAMAPYRHFADRAALMLAIAATGFDRLHDRLAAADAAANDARAALVEQGLAYIAFARDHPALFRLMFSSDPSTDRAGCGDAAYAMLAGRVESLRPADADAAVTAAWALVHGVATLVLDGRLPPEPEAHRAALVLLTRSVAGAS